MIYTPIILHLPVSEHRSLIFSNITNCKLSEKDPRPAEPEPYLYQSLPRAYETNVEATQWPSLLSGTLPSKTIQWIVLREVDSTLPSKTIQWIVLWEESGLTCVIPPDKSKIWNGDDIMLACSPRSHEVTLRASAYALSRASRRRRTAFYIYTFMR